MRQLGLVIGVLLLFVNSANAEPFDLRGIKLGMTLKEFKAMDYPDLGKFNGLKLFCSGDSIPSNIYGAYRVDVDASSAKAGLIRCMHFAPQSLGSLTSTEEATLSVAGVETFTTFDFAPNEEDPTVRGLLRINVDSNMMYWDQFWAAYTKKYGEPNEIDNGTVQNSYGATYSKIVASWKNDESSITLEQRNGNLKTMKIIYLYDPLARTYLKRLEKMTDGASDQL
jgi:hypothetical protein